MQSVHALAVEREADARERARRERELLSAAVPSPGRAAPPPPPSPPRSKWTRRVPHPVLIGHAASLTPYQSDTPRPSPRTDPRALPPRPARQAQAR